MEIDEINMPSNLQGRVDFDHEFFPINYYDIFK